MKVISFNGSSRKDSNTAILINHVLEELRNGGINTELIQLAGKKIHSCRACYQCYINQDNNCSLKDDDFNGLFSKMIDADGIILGSPVYVAGMSPVMKALVDRTCMVAKANGGSLRHKVGASVVAVRRAGSIVTMDSINHLFFVTEMIVPGSSYWNMAFGLEKGDVDQDEEGIRTMVDLGRNMTWLLKKLHS